MLGTWKVGGIVVPVNPMLRERELAFVLRDSEAAALVSLESLHHEIASSALPGSGVRVVVTTSELDLLGDTLPPLLASARRSRPRDTHDLLDLAGQYEGAALDPVRPAPGDIAFLTYTSGTTGPPKGAMNTHANVVFNAHAYRDWAALGTEDVVLGVAPLFHITGLVAHLAVAMLVPTPLVLGYRFDADTVLELVERYRATFTIGSITVFVALMSSPRAGGRDLSSLTKVLSGGAPIAPATLAAWEASFGS
jgi:long-chain acyl-CoA synthetase